MNIPNSLKTLYFLVLNPRNVRYHHTCPGEVPAELGKAALVAWRSSRGEEDGEEAAARAASAMTMDGDVVAQQLGASDKNFSAQRPKGSRSRSSRRRCDSITWEQGARAPKHSSNITSSQFSSTSVSNRARVTMLSCGR